MAEAGLSSRCIARELGVNRATVGRDLACLGLRAGDEPTSDPGDSAVRPRQGLEIAALYRHDILDGADPPVLIAHGKGQKDRAVPMCQRGGRAWRSATRSQWRDRAGLTPASSTADRVGPPVCTTGVMLMPARRRQPDHC